VVSEAQRTYWLTTPCRVRRERQSLAIERADGSSVHIPVTDVRDLVALAPVDVNTAAVSLLARHGIALHLLDEYGNYAGQLAPADGMCAGKVVRRQVTTAEKPAAALAVARELVLAATHNVRWAFDTSLLAEPLATLKRSVQAASTGPELMAAEGTFRRASWSLLDEELPPWLRLHGRSHRPPRNAGNAFISFTNGILYSLALTRSGLLHCTPASASYTPPWPGTVTPSPWTWPNRSSRCLPNACFAAPLTSEACARPTSRLMSPPRRSPPPAASGSSQWYATSWPRPCTTDVCTDGSATRA